MTVRPLVVITALLTVACAGEPPEPAPEPASAPAAPAEAPKAATPGMCGDDVVRFACTLVDGRAVALCSSKSFDPGWLQIRISEPGHTPALAHMEMSDFRYRREAHARSESLHVTYTSGDTRIDVWDQDTYGTESDHGSGITEGPDGSGKTTLCADAPTLDLESLAGVIGGP